MPSAPENLLITKSRDLIQSEVVEFPVLPTIAKDTNDFFADRDIVKLNSSGQLLNYFANKGTAGGGATANSTIVGIAMEDSGNTLDGNVRTRVKVAAITSGTILELPVFHNTPASAVTSRADVGRLARLYWHPNGAICVNLNVSRIAQDSADNLNADPELYHVRIVGISPRYPVGEQFGTYLVKFRAIRTDYDGSEKTRVHDLLLYG